MKTRGWTAVGAGFLFAANTSPSVRPVSGKPALMRDGHDSDDVRLDEIVKAVRESPQVLAPGSFRRDHRGRLWELQDHADGAPDFLLQGLTRTTPFLVIPRGLGKFGARFRVELAARSGTRGHSRRRRRRGLVQGPEPGRHHL